MLALIIEAALRSLALGIVVWLAMLALRPRNPYLHKTIWITVLLASIAMPFVLKWGLAPRFDVPTYFTVFAQSGDGAARAAAGSTAFNASSLFATLPIRAITFVYVAICLGLLVRFAVGLLGIWRIRRAATAMARASVDSSAASDPFDIRVSAKILSPATFGSTILLPASSNDWSERKLAAVLSHERSHVKNRDCYVQWLARLNACIFWFNPLAWWLQRRLAELAETTSDDAVIEAMADRTEYADVLLEIARDPIPGRVVMSAARPNLVARIDRIISNVPPASPPRRWVRGLAVALLIPPFIVAAANTAPVGADANTEARPAERLAGGPDADPMAPKVIDIGDLGQREALYPAEAKRLGIEAIVSVSAVIDADGKVLDVTVLDQSPAGADYDFSNAARSTAQLVRFSNPRQQATQVKFRVKFELKN